MNRLFLTAGLTLLGITPIAVAQPVKRADLKPGLLLSSRAQGQTLTRLSPRIACTLFEGEASHPQLMPESEFVWSGYFNVIIPGTYQFDALLVGDVRVEIGGQKVLSGTTQALEPGAAVRVSGAQVTLAAGFQPITVTLQRTGPAVRLELLWKGPGFQFEPIPYFFLGHRPQDRPDHYLSDLARDHGRYLFEEFRCAQCHHPEPNAPISQSLIRDAGPDLTTIGQRVSLGWLDAWLTDPRQLRPHTTMPRLFSDDESGAVERYAIITYLKSLSLPSETAPLTGGSKDAKNGERLYISVGCAACHGDQVNAPPTRPKPRDDDDDDAPQAKPEDQIYSLGTTSVLGDYRLGAIGNKYSAAALAQFLLNPHANNPRGRMPAMQLTAAEARDLALFLVKATDSSIPTALPQPPIEKSAEEWKMLGKALMTEKGCTNCHTLHDHGQTLPQRTAPPLSAIKTGGCLDTRARSGAVPIFHFSDAERLAVTEFLTASSSWAGSPAPIDHARRTLKRFNCLNCHSREGEGGISDTLADLMKNQLSAESTDDFLPPKLNSVGHKLRTAWLNEVLVRQGRSRPWMAIRMPNYAEPHLDQLAKDFAKIEGTIPDDAIATVEVTPEKIEAGRTLAGKTANGFGCISCHDISGIRGGGTRGPDLATIHQRLRIDWYTLWMHQPQRLSPGTKMPQNFLDGKSPLTAILKGDANAQIEAMWAYFSQGPGLPLPEGIEPPNHGIIIPVKDRPEILRTFLPEGAGTRPVAVGYPGGVNIAFDTATCRLAYAWAGPFLDASPVWTNRGGRPAIVLGTKFWSAPSGHPWFLTDGEPPRPKGRDTDPAYGAQLPDDALATGPHYVRFRGYTLDEQGYPTFRYSLADAEHRSNHLEISETPRANVSPYASGWSRRFQVQVPQPRTAWFLVATSTDRIRITPQRAFVPQAAGGWHVYEISNTAKWYAIADADNSQRLFFQLPSGQHDMTLKLWSVPTSNEEILRMLK